MNHDLHSPGVRERVDARRDGRSPRKPMSTLQEMLSIIQKWLYPFLPADVRLGLEMRALRAYFQPQIAAAKGAQLQEEVESLNQEWAEQAYEIQEASDLALQAKLFRRARRWLVLVPKLTDENSDPCLEVGARLLNDAARFDLVREIREAQREWLQLLVPIFGAVAGVIAAATGFVAVWRR